MEIQNLSLATEIRIEGVEEPLVIDFSDKRVTNKILHLIYKYENIEKELQEKIKALDSIESEFEKMLAFSDIEIGLLEEFKNDVDSTFNTNLTEKMFGKCLPAIERYYILFDKLIPCVNEAKTRETEAMQAIMEKYGVGRISKEA